MGKVATLVLSGHKKLFDNQILLNQEKAWTKNRRVMHFQDSFLKSPYIVHDTCFMDNLLVHSQR